MLGQDVQKLTKEKVIDLADYIMVKIIKIKEAENPLHPDNIPEGFSDTSLMPRSMFKEPEIGRSFRAANLTTSVVVEIINKRKFRTLNSIYEWNVSSASTEQETPKVR